MRTFCGPSDLICFRHRNDITQARCYHASKCCLCSSIGTWASRLGKSTSFCATSLHRACEEGLLVGRSIAASTKSYPAILLPGQHRLSPRSMLSLFHRYLTYTPRLKCLLAEFYLRQATCRLLVFRVIVIYSLICCLQTNFFQTALLVVPQQSLRWYSLRLWSHCSHCS
jgi:hypothetical protein